MNSITIYSENVQEKMIGKWILQWQSYLVEWIDILKYVWYIESPWKSNSNWGYKQFSCFLDTETAPKDYFNEWDEAES